MAFFVDWLSWGYLAYCVVYLLNKYWYKYHVNYYGTLTLPPWGWVVVVFATLELAALSHAFGQSIGLSIFGFRVLDSKLRSPSLGSRVHRYLEWHLAMLMAPFDIIVNKGRSGLLHDRTSGSRMTYLYEVRDQLPTTKPKKWFLRNNAVMTLALIGFTFWVGWLVTEIDLGAFFGNMGRSAYLWKDLVTPSFEHFLKPELKMTTINVAPIDLTILGGMIETIFMALLATVIGGIIAFPLSFLGARNIMGFSPLGWTIYGITRGFFNIFRSIESILWGIIFGIWVGYGPFAGVLALTIHTIAALGKLYSEQVESIDPGPLEAIAATGAARWQVVFFGVIPQIVPSYLAFSLYRWDINVRMSTVIALVGGGGIGRFFFFYKNSIGLIPNNWNQVGAVVITIVAVVWSLDYISGRVRERIT
jgi:phosphonate ABC transporter permease subunit PhnE